MTRILRALALILIIILVAAGCSAPSSADYDKGADTDYGNDGLAPAEYTNDEAGTGQREQQVIYEAYLDVSVADINETVQDLNRRASELGGYVADSVRDTSSEKPSARISYRIPQAKYPDFLAYVREQGEPGKESVYSTDVSEEFVDLEARLENRKLHEERLLQMLTQTGDLSDLLAVERELARIREDIEIIEGRLRYLSERVAMARVEISLDQLPGETDIPGMKPIGLRETLRRSMRALISSCTAFLDVISFLFIVLAAVLPFAIPVALVVWLIIHRRRKNKAKSA